MIYILLQIFTLATILAVTLRYYPFGFFNVFYYIFVGLIVIPFQLMYLNIEGIADIHSFFNTRPDEFITLKLYKSDFPLVYCLLGQWFVFFGYWLALVKKPESSAHVQKMDSFLINIKEEKALKILIIGLALVSSIYLLIRFSFYPDHPLISYFLAKKPAIRELAWTHATAETGYFFQHSILQQFVRIILPALFLWCLLLWWNSRLSWIWILLAGAVVFTLVFGSFKRTPIIYIILWFSIFLAYQNPRFKLSSLVAIGLLTVLILVFVTYLYYPRFSWVLQKLFYRVFLAEARGEYLAYLHYGSTFDFEGLSVITNYIKKVLGDSDIMTFSQKWKIATGGSRGFTSIGVVAESYVFFGLMGVLPLLAFGAFLGTLENFTAEYMTPSSRPIFAGLITVLSFSSAKGLLSQLFTGGTLTLCMLGVALFVAKRFIVHAHVTPTSASSGSS